jgi:tetratricopeptide (TPR) repeat protein
MVSLAWTVWIACAGLGSRPAAAQGAPSPPAAQPAPDARAEWERLLDEGRSLFTDDADYAQALERFQRSYQLSPNWQALNGIALVYQQQGLHVDAFDTYQRLLADFDDVLSTEQRTRVERRVEWLEARIGSLVLDAPQAGARILVDGREVGVGPLHRTVRVMPGNHAVIATLPGHEPMTRTIAVAAGGGAQVDVALRPSQVRLERPDMVRRMKPWIPWVTLGGGLAGVGAGVLLQLDARRDRDDVEELIRRHWEIDQKPVRIEDDPRYQRAQIKNGFGISLYVVGGAVAVTGAVLAVLNQPHMRFEARRVQLVPTRNGVSLAVPF